MFYAQQTCINWGGWVATFLLGCVQIEYIILAPSWSEIGLYGLILGHSPSFSLAMYLIPVLLILEKIPMLI